MDSFLGLGIPENASKAAVRAKLEDKTKDELITIATGMLDKVKTAESATPATMIVGGGGGFVLGEVLSVALYAWGKADTFGSTFIKSWYTPLRTIPAALLGVLALLIGKDGDTKTAVASWCAGMGLTLPATARFIDWILYQGDLNEQEEQALRAENAAIKAKAAAAGVTL